MLHLIISSSPTDRLLRLVFSPRGAFVWMPEGPGGPAGPGPDGPDDALCAVSAVADGDGFGP